MNWVSKRAAEAKSESEGTAEAISEARVGKLEGKAKPFCCVATREEAPPTSTGAQPPGAWWRSSWYENAVRPR